MIPLNARCLLAAALFSGSAFALEEMDDTTLSDASGQDGVSIVFDATRLDATVSGIVMNALVLHDSDGYSGATSPGAIVFGDQCRCFPSIATPAILYNTALGSFQFTIDATGDVDTGTPGNQSALNIVMTTPGNLSIYTGDMYVAHSNGQGNPLDSGSAKIIDNFNLFFPGSITVRLSLGNESQMANQGAMFRVSSTLSGGLVMLNGFTLRDSGGAVSGGTMGFSFGRLVDTIGGTDLTFDAKIDVAPNGMQVDVVTLGNGGVNAYLTGVKFGDAAAPTIGNLDVYGLQLAGNRARIVGH